MQREKPLKKDIQLGRAYPALQKQLLKNNLPIIKYFALYNMNKNKERWLIMKNKTICLNMIVKNESAVIRRALSSIKHKIDYWVILDTGSTDGTQAIVQDFLKDIPGEFYERPWVNFEHNRNEALEYSLGKSDYILFIDADEEWVFSKDFDKNALYREFYAVRTRDQNVDLHRILLIKNTPHWRWKGVLHEELVCSEDAQGALLEGVVNYGLPRDGNRAKDPARYRKDAEVLEKALSEDPTNARYAFFLAQSYGSAGETALSLKYYQKRAEMGGFRDEVFWSLFSIGCLQEDLHMDEKLIVDSYSKAFQFDPTRVEPLDHLSAYYQKKHNHLLSYIIAKFALELPPPPTLFYVVREIHDYSLLLKYACAAHFIGKIDEAKAIYEELLLKPNLPDPARYIIDNNFGILKKTLNHERR